MLDQGILSKYRAEIMGVAAIMIYFAHAYAFVDLTGITSSLFSLGNVGVDVFLAMTGFGMAFSMSSRRGIRDFYIKRAVRVGVPFLCLSIPYFLFADFLMFAPERASAMRFMLDCSTLVFWFYHTGAWYVSMLVPLYLITPLWASFDRGFSCKVIPAALGVALCWGGSFALSPLLAAHPVIANVAFVVERLPSFFVGYWLGSTWMAGVRLSLGRSTALVLSAALLFVWLFVRRFVPSNFLAALGVVLLLATGFEFSVWRGHRFSFVITLAGFLKRLGGSLESYLLNIYLLELTSTLFAWHGWILYVAVIAFVLLGALFLSPLFAQVTGRLLRVFDGRKRLDR